MRISDWSSDVCSSDLLHGASKRLAEADVRQEWKLALRASVLSGLRCAMRACQNARTVYPLLLERIVKFRGMRVANDPRCRTVGSQAEREIDRRGPVRPVARQSPIGRAHV